MNKAITYHFYNCVGCPSFGTNEHGVLLCWFNTNERPRVFTPEEGNILFPQDEWITPPQWFPYWCPINDVNCNVMQE